MDENVLSCVPVLKITDAKISCEYYCKVLGFTKNWEHQFGPGFPLFVSVSRGPTTLFLTEHPECSPGALVYFYVKEVDSLSKEFKKNGAAVDLDPTDQPWGVREMRVRDPDGNRLRFGQTLQQKT